MSDSDRGAGTLLVLELDALVGGPGPDASIDDRALRAEIEHDARVAWSRAGAARLGDELRVALEHGGRRLEIRTRLDARRDTRRGARVEVLRVVAGEHAGTDRDEHEVERAALAATLLSLHGERVAGAAVVDLAPDGAELRRVDVAWTPTVWEARLRERLDALLEALEQHSRQARARRELAASLAFPFDEVRPGQDALLRDAEGAARGGLVLLCSAPTGTGKTAAALLPLLRAALAEGRQLFFATAKTSQQQLALDTLRRVLPPGSPALAVQVSARHRVCPMEQHRCGDGRCPLQARFRERLRASGLHAELAGLGVVDAEQIAPRALEARLCPFEVALELARGAAVIVGDFNYVFDPRVRLAELIDVDDEERRPLLIVDEAHNLAERAREYGSPRLDLASLETCAADLASLPALAYRETATLLRDVAAALRDRATILASERSEPGPWVETPERAFWARIAERAALALPAYTIQAGSERERPAALRAVPSGRDPRPRDPARSLLYAVRDFARAATADPERFAAIWSPEEARVLCLDPAPLLEPAWSAFHAAVCMSATLVPFDLHARTLGLESPRTERLDLASPFPRANRLLLASDAVDTTWKRRSDDAAAVAGLIARCVALRPGNYLAFFGSFRYRDEVVAKLPGGAARVLLQLPGMPAGPILRRLEQNRDETLLVCGVLGGLLAEGVDYPGHLAQGVFVVGPGLPAVTLERELIRTWHEQQSGEGFAQAYLLPGLSRVVQAGGRAIRGPDDRAFTALLCRRFAEPAYRDPLPAWWRDELVDARDPVPALRAFWERAAPS